MDDDATLTQFASSWVAVMMGGERLQDSYYISQEMNDKHGSTSLLLNGQATCFLVKENGKKLRLLFKNLCSKNSNNPDTLINMIYSPSIQEKHQRLQTGTESAEKSHLDQPFIPKKEIELNQLVSQNVPAVLA
jgi:hypothetical protein